MKVTAKLEILIIKNTIHLLHRRYSYSKALRLLILKRDNNLILLKNNRLRNICSLVIFQLKNNLTKNLYNLVCNILSNFLQIPLEIRLQAISMQSCRITLTIIMRISLCRKTTTTAAKVTTIIVLTVTAILRIVILYLQSLILNEIEMLHLIWQ